MPVAMAHGVIRENTRHVDERIRPAPNVGQTLIPVHRPG